MSEDKHACEFHWLRSANQCCLIVPVCEDRLVHLIQSARKHDYLVGDLVHGLVCEKGRLMERTIIVHAQGTRLGVRLGAMTSPSNGICYHSLFAHLMPHELCTETIRENLYTTSILTLEEIDRLLERITPYTMTKIWKLREWLHSPRNREIGMPPERCIFCDIGAIVCRAYRILATGDKRNVGANP